MTYLELEQQKEEILSYLAELKQQQLYYNPGKDEWSLTQVVNHLILVESLTIKSINKKMSSDSSMKDSGFYSKIRYLIVIAFLKFKKKIKAPAQLPPPSPDGSLDELKQNWSTTRISLYNLINKFSSDNLNKEVFRHPATGYINIHQTLGFLREHLIHHKSQIKRITNSPGFNS